jgi:general secretion pathway protein F
MPRYRYKAYNGAGTLLDGEIVAASDNEAVGQLRASGLFPLEAVEQHGERNIRWWERELFAARTLPPSSLAMFTRELATLVEADVPLDEALRIIILQPMSRQVRAAAQATLTELLEGASLSAALASEGRFGEFYCSMVRAGEAGGNLSKVLRELASYFERSVETRSRIQAALVYPAVLVVMAIGALVLIASVLLPTIMPIFKDTGATPPFVIQFIVDIQAFLSQHWIMVGVLLMLALAGLVAAVRHPRTRLVWHRLVLSLPLVGALVTAIETAKFARMLGSLLGSGVPVLPALKIVGGIAGNATFVAAIERVAEDVKEGRMLSQALRQAELFPNLVLRLVAVGEETGRLEPMLSHVEKIFNGQVQRRIEQFLTLLTPALTIFMGIIVGGLIMSVMSAILSINELGIR